MIGSRQFYYFLVVKEVAELFAETELWEQSVLSIHLNIGSN